LEEGRYFAGWPYDEQVLTVFSSIKTLDWRGIWSSNLLDFRSC
jgi:hypothetical protein